MNKEYIKLEKLFLKNLEDFKQGAIDCFSQNELNQSDNDYYNQGIALAKEMINLEK
tara:strand:- start:2929 stop:3096 length:168 start_codon:yes stop_codon:yes gene_type:complete